MRDLNFTLKAGETLALVGENGAGKTTIVKLLTRLYDPDEGRILVDGVDLRDFAVEDLRAHIGVIFQDFIRYQLHGAPRTSASAASRPATTASASGPPPSSSLADRRHRQAAARLRPAARQAASPTAATSPAASGRRWRSPAPICATPN